MGSEKLHGDSADIDIYRYDDNNEIEILTGIRQHEPWKNYITIPFGGHVKPLDQNLLEAAWREVKEETGLLVHINFLVGIYGPRRFHYILDGWHVVAAERDRSSINHVFAGTVAGGTLTDSSEQKRLRWVRKESLFGAGRSIAFDHAKVLEDFLVALKDGSAKTWRHEALKLIK